MLEQIWFKLKNPFDLLKRVYKYLDFIQYISKSLESNCKNDDGFE